MARPTRAQIATRKADSPQETEDGGALVQGIEILRMLQSSQTALTASTIGALLGCSASRAEGLLSTLAEFRLLREKESAEYEADVGLLQLCSAASANIRVVKVFEQTATKFLKGQTFKASLYVADQSSALCLADLGGGPEQDVGSSWPLGQSEIGHTLIWANEMERRHALLERLCEEQPASTDGFLESVYLSFSRLEQRGYCWSSPLSTGAVLSCFAPIAAADDQPTSAIGLTQLRASTDDSDERELGELAVQISRMLSEEAAY